MKAADALPSGVARSGEVTYSQCNKFELKSIFQPTVNDRERRQTSKVGNRTLAVLVTSTLMIFLPPPLFALSLAHV
jgi:hypothetical protein